MIRLCKTRLFWNNLGLIQVRSDQAGTAYETDLDKGEPICDLSRQGLPSFELTKIQLEKYGLVWNWNCEKLIWKFYCKQFLKLFFVCLFIFNVLVQKRKSYM